MSLTFDELPAETTVFANDLKGDGFKVVSIHPGFVITDMGSDASQRMSKVTTPCLSTPYVLRACIHLMSAMLHAQMHK